MKHAHLALIASLSATPAGADMLVAARTLPARSVVGAADVRIADGTADGALTDPAMVTGLETRVTIYAGQPLSAATLGPAAVVERNQIVAVVVLAGPLTITAEGRSLGRAGPGEPLRVMNTASRGIVTGTVTADGRVVVTLDHH